MFLFDFTYDIQALLNHYWWQINFLCLVVLVLIGYLAIKKPVYACGLTIILLPTYLFRSDIFGIPVTYLELCILATFFGWLVNRIENHELRIKNILTFNLPTSQLANFTYLLPICLILLGATISVFTSPSLPAAAGIWKAYFVEPILFFIVLKDVLRDKKNKEIILWSLGISTLAISLLASYQKISAFGISQPAWIAPDTRRVTAMFTSPNAVGLFLAPIVLIYFGWLVQDLKNIKASLLKFLVIALALPAIIFTISQGTWLGLLAGFIFFSFFALSKKWTSAIVLLCLLAVITVPLTRDKLLPVLSMQDASGQNRLILWQMAADHLWASPVNFIFGAGLTGFAVIENQSRDPLQIEALLYPHNIFLNFWLEIGLLGLIGFIWLMFLFFRQGFVRAYCNTPLQIGILAAMVCLIVHGLIDVPYFKNDLAVLFWMIISLV